jgi:F-type H+-transporting ATPase subunit gamma
MPTIEGLKRKIQSTQDLQSLVKTMKAMAAVNIRQYEKALASLRNYDRTIKMGFQIILQHRQAVLAKPKFSDKDRSGVVIFGSDQGMCGQFNEQIVSLAMQTMRDRGVDSRSRVLLAVGERVMGLLEDTGQPVETVMSLPASVGGITGTVQEILLEIEDWHETEGIGQVFLFYNQQLSGASYHPHTVSLLPVDPEAIGTQGETKWPGRGLPTYTMDWAALFSALIRQYLFVSLFRAFAESMASENASRLVAMQGAERNIDDRLAELNAQFHQKRQMSITEELLDIVAGFEALSA